MVRIAFYQKHWQDVESDLGVGVRRVGDGRAWAPDALSGKPTLVCWPPCQTTIYNLVSGRNVLQGPTFETIFWSTTPSYAGETACANLSGMLGISPPADLLCRRFLALAGFGTRRTRIVLWVSERKNNSPGWRWLLPELMGPPWKEAGPHPALGLRSPAFCLLSLGTVATFLS